MFPTKARVLRTRQLTRWIEKRRHLLTRVDALVWDLFRGAKGPGDVPCAADLSPIGPSSGSAEARELADMARLHAFHGNTAEAERCVERALAIAETDAAVLVACGLFPSSHGARLCDVGSSAARWPEDPTHRLLAAAEGRFVSGAYDEARELLGRAVVLHAAPRPADPMLAVASQFPWLYRCRSLVAGLVALGAEETAESLLPRGAGPNVGHTGIFAEFAASVADGDRAERARRLALDAIAAGAKLGPSGALWEAGGAIDAALAKGARDAARAYALHADAVTHASRVDERLPRMWRAVHAAQLAELYGRIGDRERADPLLDDAARAYPRRPRPPASGADSTVGLARADALIACRRWEEARDAAEPHGRFKVPALLASAATDREGAWLFEWAVDLDAEVEAAAVRGVVEHVREALLPTMDRWGCLDSALVPPARRRPARVAGPLKLDELAPSSSTPRDTQTQSPVPTPAFPWGGVVARLLPPVGDALQLAIEALENDQGGDVEALDTALWMGACDLDVADGALRLYVASRHLQWDVGNGGFSQAAVNCRGDFEDAAAGYHAMGLPEAAALIRRAIPLAEREARFQSGEGPESPVDIPDSDLTFEDLDAELDDVGWWAEEPRIAFVRAHRAEILATLRGAREDGPDVGQREGE